MTTAIEKATIDRAGRALIDAIAPPAKVMLIGTQSTEDASEAADYRFLVIEEEVGDHFGEMARLAALLGRLLIPAEVVVVSADQVEEARAVKGTLVYQALSEGQVIAES